MNTKHVELFAQEHPLIYYWTTENDVPEVKPSTVLILMGRLAKACSEFMRHKKGCPSFGKENSDLIYTCNCGLNDLIEE